MISQCFSPEVVHSLNKANARDSETATTSKKGQKVLQRDLTENSRISLTIGESVRDEDVFVCFLLNLFVA